MTSGPEPVALLASGELKILGRIRSASNATFLCEVGDSVHCVYKPVAGEQPLWDFPDGTLAGRERASYLISAALGWNMVPHTIIRDGPAGPGMVQLWVEQSGDAVDVEDADPEAEVAPDLVDLFVPDRLAPGYLPILRAQDHLGEDVLLAHADHGQLRQLAVFDVIVNNADRKGGHVLAGVDGQVYGVDHGLCLHREDKLRTVLWGWAGQRVDDDSLAHIAELASGLDGELGEQLRPLITADEIDALRQRIADLVARPVFPAPSRSRPIPWPAF